MSLLAPLLAGLALPDQLTTLEALEKELSAAFVPRLGERLRQLAPHATTLKFNWDVQPNDDGTSHPYVSCLTLLVADGTSISLPRVDDLGCWEWWQDLITPEFEPDTPEAEAYFEAIDTADKDWEAVSLAYVAAKAQMTPEALRQLIVVGTDYAHRCGEFEERFEFSPVASTPS